MARWDRGSSITGKIQTLLLFLCFVFTLLPSLGPPVAKMFALQTFTTTGISGTGRQQYTISVGPLGYCNTHDGKCVGPRLGYDLASLLGAATSGSTQYDKPIQIGTTAFIAVPISAGISFIGMCISATGHHIGSAIWSALCGVVVSITTSIAVAVCFLTLEGTAAVFKNLNGAQSGMGHGRWMLLAASVLSGFCWILGIVECCLARQHKKHRRRDVEYVPVGVSQSASLITHSAPMGSAPSYTDPYSDKPSGH